MRPWGNDKNLTSRAMQRATRMLKFPVQEACLCKHLTGLALLNGRTTGPNRGTIYEPCDEYEALEPPFWLALSQLLGLGCRRRSVKKTMKHFENEFGGHTFCLREVDRLDDLPAEVRALVSPHIEKAFADPRATLELVATQTTLPNLAAYLRAMISNDDWQLVVEDAFLHRRVTRVGFYWCHPKCYPTTLVFRSEVSENREFADMFHLMDATYWDRVGCAGGILPASEFHSLNGYGIEQTEFLPNTEPTIFASDSNGDVFVYCSDGRAGMVSHETGDVLKFGSLGQCCNWIFEQLLAGEPPVFQCQQIQPGNDGSDGPF